MAASSTDDIPTQLAALFGYPLERICITEQGPPRISVIDLANAITKKDGNHAAQDVGYVKDRHREVTQILGDFKLRGQGQKKTPVTDLRGVVELTFLLPGCHAARVRRQAAGLLCRYLGGALSLVDESLQEPKISSGDGSAKAGRSASNLRRGSGGNGWYGRRHRIRARMYRGHRQRRAGNH